MDLLFYYSVIHILILIQGAVSYDTMIIPKVNDDFEESNVTFNCVHNGSGKFIIWRRKDQSNICVFGTKDCSGPHEKHNGIACSCNKESMNETNVSLQISNITSADHNTTWICAIAQSTEQTQNATLFIKVPVKTLNIIPMVNNIEISENRSTKFVCNTSYSRPIPEIRWILKDRLNSHSVLQLIGEQTNNTNTIGLTSAKSTVYYRSNRTSNGWMIYCLINKSNVQKEDIVSSYITMNVTYPPDSKLMINGLLSKGYYSVIDKSTGVLTCKITGGNPKPLLTWNRCFSNETSTGSPISSDESVTNTLTWQAISHTDRNCTCQSQQKERNESVSVYVEVLYPPTVPTMTYSSLNVSGKISVLIGKSLLLDCDSNSNPPPTYFWTAKKILMSANKTLLISKVEKEHAGQYVCSASNTMNSTDKVQRGSNIQTIDVKVLFRPSIKTLENLIMVEGAQLNVSCEISPGNPSESKYLWISEKNKTWPSKYLTIRNISRNDDTNYNCTVYNTLIPTGKSPVNGTDSRLFHLSVEYYATIKEFFVNGYKFQSNIIVNETDNVTFICNIDSKPISNTSLRFRTYKTLFATDSNSLKYTLGSAKCEDAGAYFCNGNNKHNNGTDSAEQLNVFVRCSPRANTELPFSVNITSAKNNSAVLHFPFIAFPSPYSVIWQKYSKSNWTNITSNININISSFAQNVSLTIHSVTETDFGQYRLIISNDVDSYIQDFFINAEDKPNSPTDFRVLNELTTASSATLQWSPSFNGGKSQHFVLSYSKSNEDRWSNKEVNDSGEAIMNYTVKSLSSASVYYIAIYSTNSIGSSKISDPLEVQTKAISAKTETNSIGIVVGSVCSVIGILLLVIFVIWLFRKRRNEKAPDRMIYQNVPTIGKPKQTKERKHTSLIRETQFLEGGLQEVDDVPHIAYERTEYNNSPEKIKEIDTVRVSELFQYVLGQTEDDFDIEYQQIPTELQSSIAFARKPENIALNRYNGIFPYDHSRVKIPTIPDFFMNACYIDGYKRRNAYIASLGPTEKTTNNFITFWQMVWYEKSDLIVMLTNLREPSGMKCEQYWPDSGTTMTYGEMCVSNVNTAIFSEFTVKRFLLSKGKDQRSITHLHFTAWPDKTVPEDTTTLIEFRHQMKTTSTSSSGPIIVHCSAGIGRTGTLIAFDRLVAEGQDKHDVNIFECVKSMRKQRVKMVQTLEQYIYIYKALVGTLCFESSYMTVKDLRSLVGTPKHMYSKEYQQLKQTVDTVKKDEKDAFNRNENQTSKNRPGADVPGNRFRVFLNLNREHEDSDYINAVYINSFVKKEFFILAQTPLPGATEDFICLIYQEDCTCVVSMHDQKDTYQNIGKYLPDGDKILKIGSFKVSCSVLETKHHYTLKKMKICYEGRYERGEKIVYHFQYTQWLAEMEIPDNNVDFVQFVKDVHQYACELGDERSHVLAHCLKANERSGLFCAVLIILEKLDKESQVNISNTIRHLRTRRRSAITSMEQLQFCYQAASLYAKQLSN